MSKMNQIAAALMVSMATLTGSATAATIFSDNFADGNRDGWLLAGVSGYTSVVTDGVWTLNGTANTLAGLAYFMPSGSPVNLQVGESISASFVYSFTTAVNANASFRVGLFNSGGNRISADLTTGNSDSAFNNYTGYAGFSTAGTFNNGNTVRSRDKSDASLFGTNPFTTLGAQVNANYAPTVDVFNQVSLKIERTEDSLVSITSTVNGNNITRTVSSSPFIAYDTFAFWLNPNLGNVKLDDVAVTYTQIPEPASLALMLVGAVGLLARRRA